MVEVDVGVCSFALHAASVTAAVEGADVGTVGYVVVYVAVVLVLVVEDYVGDQLHGAAVHVLGEIGGIGQVNAVVLSFRVFFFVFFVIQFFPVMQFSSLHGVQHAFVVDVVTSGGIHHALAVVAEVQVLNIYPRTDAQLQCRLRLLGLQCGAVAAEEHTALDDGRLCLVAAVNAERHLLGIGTEVVESLQRSLAGWHLVVHIAIDGVILQVGIVGIGIGAVAAAEHVALDVGVDAEAVAAVDAA